MNGSWLQIEVTTRCNMRCEYCERTFGAHVPADFPLDLASTCFTRLPTVDAVMFQGFGEPLLYRELAELLALARSLLPVCSLQLTTNGMLTTDRALAAVALTDVIHCSFDSRDPGYWRKTRVGGDADRILANLRTYRAQQPRVEIFFNVVVSRANLGELDALLELCALEGHQGVSLLPLVPLGRGFAVDENVVSEPALLADEGERLVARGARLGLKMFHPFGPASRRCLWPERGVYVRVDGRVTPCCVMSGPSDLTLGSLRRQSLAEILRSSAALSFRRSWADTPACATCLALQLNSVWNDTQPLPLLRSRREGAIFTRQEVQ